ncbi:MAG: hypothetical protein AAF668_01825 [Pseudomonadota bacterium]
MTFPIVTFPKTHELDREGFEPDLVLSGSETDGKDSDGPGQLLIECDGTTDLIKFYGAQYHDTDEPPLIFLSGDVVERTKSGFRVHPGYHQNSPASIQIEAEEFSKTFNRTFVQLARPGIYGSTGNHMHRRRPHEVNLVDAAISKLVDTFEWEEIDVAGLSGGGHLAACLAARRNDIRRLTIGSGNVAVRDRLDILGLTSDVTGFDDFVDPICFVEQIADSNVQLITMITDPRDALAPAHLQIKFANLLRGAGARVDHQFVDSADPNHHVLYEETVIAASRYR